VLPPAADGVDGSSARVLLSLSSIAIPVDEFNSAVTSIVRDQLALVTGDVNVGAPLSLSVLG